MCRVFFFVELIILTASDGCSRLVIAKRISVLFQMHLGNKNQMSVDRAGIHFRMAAWMRRFEDIV